MMISKKDILRQLILLHKKVRKDLTVRDIYKMLYQSNLGNKHILKDEVESKKRLIDELNSAESHTKEPLLENISTSNEIFRVNLRSFKKLNLSAELLYKIIIESSKVIVPNIENLITQWQLFKELAEEKVFNFEINSVRIFDENVKRRNYPVISHSDVYRKMYNPSYRVVHIEIFEKIFDEINKREKSCIIEK